MSLFSFLHEDPDPAAFRPTPGNAAALRAIALEELRRVRALWIYGPPGCGKTHLLSVASGVLPTARRMTPERLQQRRDDDWFGAHLLLDDADRVEDLDLLLHVLNAVKQGGGIGVFTARVPPGALPVRDDSLRSRLLSMAGVAMDRYSSPFII